MTDGDDRERKLRRYETILESIDDAVYAVRPDGTIAYVNDRYAEMKGVDREELIGTDIYDWVAEETAAKAKQIRTEFESGASGVGAVEYEFLTADGERFPVEMRFARVTNESGGELDRVGVIRDVRERKRREESLRRKNERLSEFASIVSHDLRNPLSVAAGRLELAREECDSPHLDDVASAHDRMETLIDDLLALARNGEDVEDMEQVALNELAEECWKGVDVGDATLHVETEHVIRADRSRLKQLFENLVRNSVEHGRSRDGSAVSRDDENSAEFSNHSTSSRTQSGDSVEHTDEDVEITVGDLDGGFYVADNGPGIPATERDRVFETGYSTDEEGTGFGLSIVKAIATAHGWDVQITDATDGGARFEFTGVELLDTGA